MEAVAANLTILKSPTVLRQHDGRLWLWEGSGNSEGWCYGSCTHAPRINGDFSCFISTASGYGLVGVKDGEPFLEVWSGCIDVSDIQYKKYNE